MAQCCHPERSEGLLHFADNECWNLDLHHRKLRLPQNESHCRDAIAGAIPGRRERGRPGGRKADRAYARAKMPAVPAEPGDDPVPWLLQKSVADPPEPECAKLLHGRVAATRRRAGPVAR